MNVSAADILTVATYLWGSYDPKEAFASMARRIVDARPNDWQTLMRAAEALRHGVAVLDYDEQARRLREYLGA